MKNSINKFSFLLVFILSSFYATNLFAQDEQLSKNISLIAERDFKVFLEKIPVGMEANFGFSDRNEFVKATIGSPMSVLLPTQNFYSSNPIDSIHVNFEVSQIWEVPVLVNGNICCLLRLNATNNNCAIIGIGGYLTAYEIDKLSKFLGLNKENKRYILKFPDIQIQYLLVFENSISYRNSKCYRIEREEEYIKPVEDKLLNVLVASQKLQKERKGLYYEK
jgi:hypothetical protein